MLNDKVQALERARSESGEEARRLALQVSTLSEQVVDLTGRLDAANEEGMERAAEAERVMGEVERGGEAARASVRLQEEGSAALAYAPSPPLPYERRINPAATLQTVRRHPSLAGVFGVVKSIQCQILPPIHCTVCSALHPLLTIRCAHPAQLHIMLNAHVRLVLPQRAGGCGGGYIRSGSYIPVGLIYCTPQAVPDAVGRDAGAYMALIKV